MNLDDFLSSEAVEAIYRPVEEAEGLPGNVYTDPAFWTLERERYFSRTWMACAFLNDIPEPGDVFPVSIGGWDLLLTRDGAGEVHVFHNICSHRGMKVVDQPCNVGTRMHCPWHSWAYEMDGTLAATPNLDGIGAGDAPGFDKRRLALRRVPSATWLNFVFVNIDGKAPALAEHLAPLVARLKGFDLSLLEPGPKKTQFTFHGNWKLAYEGGVEDYHIPWIHPGLGPHSGSYKIEAGGGQTFVGISSRRLLNHPDDKRGEAFRGTGKQGDLPIFPHLAAHPVNDGLGFETLLLFVPPSAVVAVLANHLATRMFLPVAVDRTIHRIAPMFIGEGAYDPAFESNRNLVVEGWRKVAEEDAPLVRQLQLQHRLRAELDIPTRFSPYWEPSVLRFQQLVIERLREP